MPFQVLRWIVQITAELLHNHSLDMLHKYLALYLAYPSLERTANSLQVAGVTYRGA